MLTCLVLTLGENKFWIGETRNVENYLKLVLEGSGPRWVQKHGFVSIYNTIPEVESSKEILDSMIEQFGEDNVRGTLSVRQDIRPTKMIYVLRLEGGSKFYVGSTTNIERRMEEHRRGAGSGWTSVYEPLEENPIECYPTTSPFEETRKTLELMSLHGINNVRGACFCNINLTRSEVKYITRNMRSEDNLCLECGRSDHWISECPLISR